jgi:transposase-like protein
MQTIDTTRPTCSDCGADAIRWGKDRNRNQRWRCRPCSRTWTDTPPRLLGSMRLDPERAVLVLSLLVEGNSIRSAERVTGHHRDTIMRLLALVGGKCERLLDRLMRGVELKDVQAPYH